MLMVEFLPVSSAGFFGRFRYNNLILRPLTYPMILPGRFIVMPGSLGKKDALGTIITELRVE